jgi:hypothetical protein
MRKRFATHGGFEAWFILPEARGPAAESMRAPVPLLIVIKP